VSGTWSYVVAAYLGAGVLYVAYLAHLLHQRRRLADQLVEQAAVHRAVAHELALVDRIETTDLAHRRGSAAGSSSASPSSASPSSASPSSAAASAHPSPTSASDRPGAG
jgi:hypothetical protein